MKRAAPDDHPVPQGEPLPDDLCKKAKYGLIGGSAVPVPEGLQKYYVQTPFGYVAGLCFIDKAQEWLFISRHHCTRFKDDGSADYAPPHAINFHALVWALKDAGVQRVIAFGSAGTLHPDRIPVGSVLMPDDYFMAIPEASTFWPHPSIGAFGAEEGQLGRMHYTPAAKDDTAWVEARKAVQASLNTAFAEVKDTVNLCKDQTPETWPCFGTTDVLEQPISTYVQTAGPRFETRSEIRHYARCGDVVGMTCGKEWALCNELLIPYVLVCSIENSCNGLSRHPEGALQEYLDHKGKVATVIKSLIAAMTTS